MSAGAQDNELKKLYRERDAKFVEIVSCLQRELHPDTASLTKMDWEQLAEDAEELTDNWAAAEADNRLPGVTTELQRLLSEHQEFCRRIIDILDAGSRQPWAISGPIHRRTPTLLIQSAGEIPRSTSRKTPYCT